MVQLEPVRPVTVFQAVFDQLSALLAGDAFAPGDRLPPERFRVSRPSVREGMKARRLMRQHLAQIRRYIILGAFEHVPTDGQVGAPRA